MCKTAQNRVKKRNLTRTYGIGDLTGLTVLLVGFSVHIHAQTVPAFEVASIRVHPKQAGVVFGISGPNVTIASPPMLGLISMGYNVEPYQVVGGPSWMTTERFEIRARAPGDGAPTREQAGRMLQALLAERFQLKLHREKRDLPVYLLVVARDGPKLKPSTVDSKSFQMNSGAETTIKLAQGSMEELARHLTDAGVGRPVVNKTGLSGNYDLELSWSPWVTEADTKAGAPPSIFTAIRELGLRLEPGKGAAEVLVIDHVEHPSEN